jgi:hypothetical protein
VRVSDIGDFFLSYEIKNREERDDVKVAAVAYRLGIGVAREAVNMLVKTSYKMHADMLVLISYKHDMIGRLFHAPIQHLSYTLRKPILVLPQRITESHISRLFNTEIGKN